MQPVFSRARSRADARKAGRRVSSPRETQRWPVIQALAKEPLIAVLPAGHRLTSRKKIRPQDLAGEIYVSSSRTSPVLESVIHHYALKIGITLKAGYEGENLPAAVSLVTSTGGVTLIPLYAQNMLTPNVVARALDGIPPTIDLALGIQRCKNQYRIFLQTVISCGRVSR